MSKNQASFELSQRIQQIQDPIIPIVGDWIKASPGTISLGQGIVYYGPPPGVHEKIAQFFGDPSLHSYQAVEGIPLLLAAIRDKLQTENQVPLTDEHQLVVTAGSNMAFSHAINAIVDVGDEVLLFSPFYFNHEMAIDLAGAKVVVLPVGEDYLPDLNQIASAINSRTRAIVTVSPNNPTGKVYPKSLLTAINQLCREKGLYHIHDEAYEYFNFGEEAIFSPASLPDTAGHTISLYSLSKAYGFASWRIGYMLIPQALFHAIRKVQDTQLICATVLSQYAALACLEAGRAYCDEKILEIAKGRSHLLNGLETIKDRCKWLPTHGALYQYVNLPDHIDETELVQQLIADYKVAVIPGHTFGAKQPGIRISFGALEAEVAAEGVTRLVEGLDTLLR